MLVLSYLLPKAKVVFIHDDYSVRQALEKMKFHRYTSIPLLNNEGRYLGTITEGDILWFLMDNYNLNLREAENVNICTINRLRDYRPVSINNSMSSIIQKSIDQNYVPVIDDLGNFIGIITRKKIIQYCLDKLNINKIND